MIYYMIILSDKVIEIELNNIVLCQATATATSARRHWPGGWSPGPPPWLVSRSDSAPWTASPPESHSNCVASSNNWHTINIYGCFSRCKKKNICICNKIQFFNLSERPAADGVINIFLYNPLFEQRSNYSDIKWSERPPNQTRGSGVCRVLVGRTAAAAAVLTLTAAVATAASVSRQDRAGGLQHDRRAPAAAGRQAESEYSSYTYF